MAYLLGIDTGGTYTDAVIIDQAKNTVVAKAKSLTTRPILSHGISAAITSVIERSGCATDAISLVSLSTTLATNALVEGQGDRIALILIGFSQAELQRNGLAEAMAGDPVIYVSGGHDHTGTAAAPLDESYLRESLRALPSDIAAVAIAGRFATRNPAHEVAAAEIVREELALPATSSHELSSALGGPKRALTAALNGRLIGMITRLIDAVQGHLQSVGITAPLMVVRGDGALISARFAQAKPIETILSGPAASLVGAAWLTTSPTALVSDIGGTTTDICLLQDGRPKLDPAGAQVGPFRTMVKAVAMQTWGLGGDSAVTLSTENGVELGPRRAVPISLLAHRHPELVHKTLEACEGQPAMNADMLRFVIPLTLPEHADSALVSRLRSGPLPLSKTLANRRELAALNTMIARGQVQIASVTPSDALHVLGRQSTWDRKAAARALALFARLKTTQGTPFAPDAKTAAERIVAALQSATADALTEVAFSQDTCSWPAPASLATHPLTRAAFTHHTGIIALSARLTVPVVGLGASASCYYPALAQHLNTEILVPDDADVANAIGAVVGHGAQSINIEVTAPEPGRWLVHLPDGVQMASSESQALSLAQEHAQSLAEATLLEQGMEPHDTELTTELRQADIEGQTQLIGALITATARGRPALADA